MDQIDVDRSTATEVATTTKPVPDPEQSLWTEFGSASTPQAYYRSWLALQCREIGGVVQAVVLLGPGDAGPYAPAAMWPDGRRNPRQLSEVAERALTERRGLVIPRSSGREGDSAARGRYEVGYPIEVSGKLYGV